MSRRAWVDAAEYPLLSRVSRHLEKGKCCAATHGASQAPSIFSSWNFLRLASFVHLVTLNRHLLQILCRLSGTHMLFLQIQQPLAMRVRYINTSICLQHSCYLFRASWVLYYKTSKQMFLSSSEPLIILLSSFSKPPLCLINTVCASSRKHPSSGMWTNHAFIQLHSVAFCLFISQRPFFIYFSDSSKLQS